MDANIISSIVPLFFGKDKIDPITKKKWTKILTNVFRIAVCLALTFFKCYPAIFFSDYPWKYEVSSKILFFLVSLVVNCFLLDLFIQLMNKIGICDFFNLALLTSFFTAIPKIVDKNKDFFGLTKNWSNLISTVITISAVTVFIIFFSNLRWSAPIKSNALLLQKESEFFQKKSFNLQFKMDFSLIYSYYFKKIMSIVSLLFLVFFSCSSFLPGSFRELTERFGQAEVKIEEDKMVIITPNSQVSKKKMHLPLFFLINNLNSLFKLSYLKKLIQHFSWYKVALNLSFFFAFKFVIIWLQNILGFFKPKQIARDLATNEIYIKDIPMGYCTHKLLKRIINKMIVLWFFVTQIGCSMVFDNFVEFANPAVFAFIDWTNIISIGDRLIEQTNTKIQYIKHFQL